MEKTKYPDGYMPKIDFWQSQFCKAKTPEDEAHAKSKIIWFCKKQNEVYGTMYTAEDFLPQEHFIQRPNEHKAYVVKRIKMVLDDLQHARKNGGVPADWMDMNQLSHSTLKNALELMEHFWEE
jgi:hypothetical protein